VAEEHDLTTRINELEWVKQLEELNINIERKD